MRLKQIKLSGFKSFADPTAFQVPSQLVGVVGPNGCGKSNVIDAVRWVLGESKASELRGESMQDVIFNGASDRKAAARASVELVFDNSLGRIGGHWANYAELSVRRTLSRDNQSIYQINNQAVRRRDVHDMFLGTGLGPRAYAIIGQGTISRIIEAKPEELRVFLEEAAGVSKYKERRRETESRLASTRENLSRVDDIDRELGGRIDKLTRQAEVAASYRDMDDERTRNARMQWIVKRNEARASQQKLMLSVEAARTEYEARTAQLRALETRIEALRQQVDEAADQTHGAQGGYYEANAEVARLEAEIRRIGEARQSLEQNLVRLRAERDALQQRDAETRSRQADDEQRLAQLQQSCAGGEAQVDQHQESLAAAEQAQREAALELERSRHAQADNRRAAESLLVERRSNDERLQALGRRLARAQAEQAALPSADAGSLQQALASLAAVTSAEAMAQARLDNVQANWSSLDEQRVPAQEALRAAQSSHAQIDARAAALRELQNRLDKQNDMHEWLASRGMGELKPLWQRLRIDDGWEVAVENVLRERVSAIEIGQLSGALGLADQSLPAKLVLFCAADEALDEEPRAAGLRPLSSVVRSGEAAVQHALREWLRGYYVAESLPGAHAARADLPAGSSFIVRAGHRLSAHALQLFAADNEHEGVLQRQHELDNLEREGRAQSLLLDEAREHAQRHRAFGRRAGHRVGQCACRACPAGARSGGGTGTGPASPATSRPGPGGRAADQRRSDRVHGRDGPAAGPSGRTHAAPGDARRNGRAADRRARCRARHARRRRGQGRRGTRPVARGGARRPGGPLPVSVVA
ncbi:MAG: chromosome segregation protein SMC [Burkholderiaceae bacterium]